MREYLAESMQEKIKEGVQTAASKGADSTKIHLGHQEGLSCSYESGRLKHLGSGERVGLSVEVIADHRRGVASGNDLHALDDLIDRAITLAKWGSEAHFDAFPPAADVTPVRLHSPQTLSLTPERFIKDCGWMVDQLKKYDEGMDINATAGRNEVENLLVTSGGVCHPEYATSWSMGCQVQRTQDTDMLFAGYGRGWCDWNELYDPAYILDRVMWDLKNGENIVEAPTGQIPVFVPADVLPMLLNAFEMGVNGRTVAKGESPLQGRLGEQVLDAAVTLYDDPHREFCPNSAEIDGDGIPTRRTPIVDQGVLQQFLYDLDSAGLAGTSPTGHAGCRPYNLTVVPGNKHSDDLLRGIEDGIYIKQLLGFGQSNIINGDFSANLGLGYRIKNGEIAGRVKNTMVSGNLYDLFGASVQLSSDVEPDSLMPAAVLEGANVTQQAGE